MGKTKTKIIDDSKPQVEDKKPSKIKGAKSSTAKAISEVELKSEVNESNEKLGAKQTHSESAGDASGALHTDEPPSQKKPKKSSKTKPRSKKYQQVSKDLDRSKSYLLSEAIDLVKTLNYAKFNSTLEAHINTTTRGVRGLVSLPFASGKKLTILAFGQEKELEGAILGNDETIEQISKGKINFDLIVTTPQWMPKLACVAKVLGPKGLMPNPKNGTITDDLKKAVESFQGGKTEFKTEPKAEIIHLGLGKLDQPSEQLSANVKTLLQTIGKTRVKKVSLAPTMGPSVRVDLSSL